MAIGSGRGGAPGTFIYEGAIATTAGRASFNTTYMLVDAPETSSILNFPYNRPIAISSLNEYENLIGTLPTAGGPELTSYYAVKSFFQQAAVADLRVTRVGTPSVVISLAFNPAANKDNGVDAPSALSKGDKVYVKLTINGIELGDKTANGAWLGVPVEVPANYIPGDINNNLAISTAMQTAVKDAILANADISAGTYVRETGTGDPACDECAYIYLCGRVFNSPIEVVNSSVVSGNQFVFASNAYNITNVTESDQSVYDWTQCVATAFAAPELPQGYLCAPAAFSIYNKAERVNLGQTMEELCSDPAHKWMAMIDCGPYFVTSIEDYKDYLEANPSDGFYYNEQYLVENVIYKWTDTDPLLFTEANYDATSAGRSANSALADGARRALKDDRWVYVNSAVNVGSDVFTLATEWPSDLKSGEKIEVTSFINDPLPILPTYNDTYTSTTGADVSGTFYVIAKDVNATLGDSEIQLATSRTRALAGDQIDVITGGTPQGGGMLNLRYASASWEFNVTIKGKTSDVIEVNNNSGSSFNTKHFPATLQKPTSDIDFEALVRQITDPSKAVIKGGITLKYFNAANVTFATDDITVAGHGYLTGEQVKVYTVPSATLAAGLTTGTDYWVIKVDDNTIKLASSLANAEGGTPVTITDAGTDSGTVTTPLQAATQAVITQGGDALVLSADHGLNTAEKIMFTGDIASATVTVFTGTTQDALTVYYVKKEDKNTFRLTPSASNLAAGVYIDYPSSSVSTATVVRFYRTLTTATAAASSFNDAGIVRFTRGRKYQMDVTLAVFNVKDEAGVGIQNGVANPYGANYTADLSTDFRISAVPDPIGQKEFQVAAANVTVANPSVITTGTHGWSTGTAVKIDAATGATLATGLLEDTTYYVIAASPTTVSLATSLALASAGTGVEVTNAGTDNPAGIEFVLTTLSNPYTYTYTEDSLARPLNSAQDFAGANNFYCTPLTTGDQANGALAQVYGLCCLEEGEDRTTLYSSGVECEFVEPSTEVPNALYNFDAVTGGDIMSEALRGVNNNGIPQVIVIETGMDNHSRLFSESQSYSTTQGFLAYYAPCMLNDLGVYIPPTGYVTGFAMKRYRDEVGAFRLPPAGAKYALAGARGVQVEITTGMQDVSNPYGLNALRQLPGYSTTDPDTGAVFGPVFIWGSRTRINPANAEQALYKFVNTRVILNVIYGTLESALDGQIFNIIDGRSVTFNQIRTLISNVLYSQFYVPGALFGASASDAFDVIVDDRNNPSANLDNGLVNVQIFVVPVPTLERIEIDLLRVSIGGIKQAQIDLGLQ